MLSRKIFKLLGIKEQEAFLFSVLDTQQRKEMALRWLGLTPKEVSTATQLRIVSPKVWALKQLGLSPKQYKRLQSELDSQSTEEEFKDVTDEAKALAVANMQSFGSLRNFNKGVADYWYAKRANLVQTWRGVEPIEHIKKLRDIADHVIREEYMTPHEAYEMVLCVYYTIYNCMYGVKQSLDK